MKMADACVRIEAIAKAHDPAFDVIWIDHLANTLTIYRADPVPDRRAALYAPVIPKGVTVRYARSMLNLTQVNDLANLVSSQIGTLAKHGVLVTMYGDGSGEPFMIGYDPTCQKPGDALLKPFEKYGHGTAAFVPRAGVILTVMRNPSPSPTPSCPAVSAG